MRLESLIEASSLCENTSNISSAWLILNLFFGQFWPWFYMEKMEIDAQSKTLGFYKVFKLLTRVLLNIYRVSQQVWYKARLLKSIEDYRRLSKTIKDYQRLLKTFEDYSKLVGTPCSMSMDMCNNKRKWEQLLLLLFCKVSNLIRSGSLEFLFSSF